MQSPILSTVAGLREELRKKYTDRSFTQVPFFLDEGKPTLLKDVAYHLTYWQQVRKPIMEDATKSGGWSRAEYGKVQKEIDAHDLFAPRKLWSDQEE